MQLNRWQLIQATPHILRQPLAFLTAYSEHAPLLIVDGGGFQIVIVNGPDAIEHVLLGNHRNYSKQTPQFETFSLVAGNGLLSSDGDYWLQQRRLAQPAFHRSRLATWAGTMVRAATTRAQLWQLQLQNGPLSVDIEHEMHTLSLNIVCELLFGIDVHHETAYLLRAVTDALNYVIFRAQYPLPLLDRVPLPVNQRYQQARADLARWSTRLIAQRRDDQRSHDDLLQLWLDAELDDQQIVDEILTFIIAGYETVASGLTWLWYLLATNRPLTKRIQGRLDDQLGGRPPTVADFDGDLPLLRAAISEALRLYPPAWVISRRAIDNDEIVGTPVAAGSYVVISPYAVHRQARLWPQPQRFEPDRFLNGGPPHRYAYIPFGGGPRLCIGNRFAELEMTLTLATLLPHFHFDYVGHEEPVPQPLVTIRPRHGMPLILRARTLT